MNDLEIEKQVEVLQSLVGCRLNNAWQPTRDRVLLHLGDSVLLLVPRGPWARLHTVPGRPRNPARPFSFQGALRARVAGRLTAVTKASDDRVVTLSFEHHTLCLRLTGRSGGLWLLANGEVVAAYDGPAVDGLPALPPSTLVPQAPRYAPRENETWDDAARRWFTEQEREERLRVRRQTLGRALRKEITRKERLLRNLEADFERACDAPVLRSRADLLAAHLHEIQRGVPRVALPSWETPGQTIWIELDPARPPSETVNRLYAKARRMQRMSDRIADRVETTEAELEVLRNGEERLPDASSDELERLARLIPRKSQRRGGKEGATPYTVWLGPDGERVLVGRNSRSNRMLCFQVAKGDDYWFHLRGIPGAHIILPMKRGKTPSLEKLLVAAQICLVHGKVPDGSFAEVQYTASRNIRAIPGDTSGRVQVLSEKVLRVARDPSVLVGWQRQT